ncbi:MAG: PAS domain S-box protein [Pseudomonadota bacterium]
MSASEDHTLHYRLMFSENLAVMLLINPDDGRIIDASMGACQYYGYSLSDLTTMSIFDINVMSKDEIDVEMKRAKEESKNHFNFSHRLASGEVRDVEVYSNPIPMEGQKFLYSIIHDITERKQAQEQYRHLFERTGTGMAVLEADGTLSLVNRTFAQLAEADESEIIGHSFLEWVAEADKERMQEYHLKRLHGEDAPDNYEFQYKTLKGHRGWALLNISFFPNSGRTMVSAINITERKQAEQKLQQANVVVERSPAVLFQWKATKGWPVKFVSRNVNQFGYTAEELISGGVSFIEIVHPDDIQKVGEEVEKYSSAGVDEFTQEYRIVSPTGEIYWIDDRTTIERNAEGYITGYQGVVIDITERKQAEKEKEQLLNELLHSQKMESLGHLTGGIAHEFNNLLGVINGFTELAVTKCINNGDEKLLEYMRSIETASGRATKLVAEMLAFGRSEQADNLPLNISTLILENVNTLRSTLPSSIEIETKIDPYLPSVLMNPTQLKQILMNLSINARDAMDGVGKLTVRLHELHGLDAEDSVSYKPIGGDWVELSVSDTGSGIEPEIIKNIFNPFFTTKDVGMGTGMGLSIIYRIMEDHDGHILLDSKPGKGTTFRLLFPPIPNEITEKSDLTDELSEIPVGDGSEVLVVDDEEMLAVFISELVKEYGYKSHYVTDSIEALNLFKEDPDRFSILITDQTMPKITGKELVDKLKTIRPELPVIMCSGYSDKINSDEASELDFSYISKPVDAGDIMREISNLLVQRNQLDNVD